MSKQPTFPGIFVATGPVDFAALDKATAEWEARAARGECAWVCADCCMTFPSGMPDACEHGHQSCTDIIKHTKAVALAPTGGQHAD